MIHTHRVFQVAEDVSDIATLAEYLTQHTWTLCTAFKLVTSPDAPPIFFSTTAFQTTAHKSMPLSGTAARSNPSPSHGAPEPKRTTTLPG